MRLLSDIINQIMAAGLMAYIGMLVGTVIVAFLLGMLFNRIIKREGDKDG